MKKVIFSISFLCYFTVTSGIVINTQYCMKRLVAVHLFDASAICGKCGMDTFDSDGCCRGEVKVVKLQQDQNTPSFSSGDISYIEEVVSVPSQFINTSFQNIGVQHHFHNHSPPSLSEQDTYLQNNVFRI